MLWRFPSATFTIRLGSATLDPLQPHWVDGQNLITLNSLRQKERMMKGWGRMGGVGRRRKGRRRRRGVGLGLTTNQC